MVAHLAAAVAIALTPVGPVQLRDAHDPANPGPAATWADTAGGRIWLDGRPTRFVLQHEIGHFVDARRLTDTDHAWFTPRLGFAPDMPWWGTRTEIGWPVPAERFADASAACALHLDPRRNWTISYGYAPTRRQHERICTRIAALLEPAATPSRELDRPHHEPI